MNTPYLLGTYLASNKEVKGMRANCVRGARSVREVGEARGRGQAITYAYLTYAYLRLGSRSAQKPEVWEDSQQASAVGVRPSVYGYKRATAGL